MPGERLLCRGGRRGNEPVAGDEPAERREDGEAEQGRGRPVHICQQRRPGSAARPRAEGRRRGRRARRTRPRRQGGCDSCAGPARCGSVAAGSARRGRSRRRGTGGARRRGRSRSPSPGRCGCRGRRSSTAPARGRSPARGRRRRSGSRARSARAEAVERRRAVADPRGGRSGEVVIVTAGMPRATNGACSYALNGKPRSTSWRSALGRRGSAPGLARELRANRLDEAGGRRPRRVAGELEPRRPSRRSRPGR